MRSSAALSSLFVLLHAVAVPAEVIDVDVAPSEIKVHGQDEGRGTHRIGAGMYVAIGDLNADGVLDIATAGPSTHRPTVGILFGRAPWPRVLDLRIVEPDVVLREWPLFRPDGSCFGDPTIREQTDYFTNLAAGDVTGDGIDDLVMGGPCWDRGGGTDGMVLIVPGRVAWPAIIDVDPDTWTPAVLGPPIDGRLGESVAVEDVDGDGVVDLLAGAGDAPSVLTGFAQAGRVYTIRGPIADAQHEADVAGTVLDGVVGAYRLGRTIASGYLTAEHPKAIVLGQHLHFPGRVLFFDGSVLQQAASIDETRSLLGQITGERPGFGHVLAMGDVDCSGKGDLLSLDMFAETPASSPHRAGQVDLFRDVSEIFGTPDPVSDLVVTGRHQRLIGSSSTHHMLRSLHLADLDGDGFDDLILGQPTSEGPLGDVKDRGDVTIVWSRPDLPAMLDLERDSEWQLTIVGPRLGVGFGLIVGAADMDGNGRQDLVIGSVSSLKVGGAFSWIDGAIDVFLRNLHVTTVEPEAGPDQTASIAAGTTDCSAAVTLDASASIDRDGHLMRHRWYEGPTFLAESEVVTVPLPLGDHCIRLLSTSDGGWAQDKLHVTVRDQAPPEIRSIAVDPSNLWPPNHRMEVVHVVVDAWDACTSAANLSVRLLSVTSNEPADDRGDGHSDPDIAGWEVGTADFDGALRAERSGRRGGREYTLTYEVADAAGNTATGSAVINVGHDRGGIRAPTRRITRR